MGGWNKRRLSCNGVNRVKSSDTITPHESEQTSTWSLLTREPEKPTSGEKADDRYGHIYCAFSDPKVIWSAIKWNRVYRNVRRLQARIVKTTQAKRWGKVKALQHLLTRSFSAKVLAVRRVTENKGKKTPGVDGEVWNTPEKKSQAINELKQHGYQPSPLKREYIPKANGRHRPLSIPTMLDRTMQTLYLQALDPLAECQADPNSYGFRSERSTADAIEQCHIVLSNRGGAEWILEGDIGSCFDTIAHEWLEAHIPMDKPILHKWLKAGFIEEDILKPTGSGTPQGGPASPVLANLTLDGLEKKLREKYPKASNLSRRVKVNLVRYCDDFIITGSSKELLEKEVKPQWHYLKSSTRRFSCC